MSSLSTIFGFLGSSRSGSYALPEIYPLPIQTNIFVESDILNIYQKILIEVLERTHGIPEDRQALLWDNCLQSEASKGIITLLSEAMYKKSDLFLIYESSLNVIRQANSTEAEQIKRDYIASGSSSIGYYISFNNYKRTDMMRFYSVMEYCLVGSLYKSMNLSKAIQFKMDSMRSSTSLADSSEVINQAKEMSDALGNGLNVVMDGKDMIVTAVPDMAASDKVMEFIDGKKSLYLGMPVSWVQGEQTGGIGSTGENDTKAIERGLKPYYYQIIKPVLEGMLGIKTSYKSQDFRNVSAALDALRTFDLVGDELIDFEKKKIIISKMFEVE
jgi:hypothetical protein